MSSLTRRTTDLQEGLGRLEDLHATWSRTQESSRAANAPANLLQQVADLSVGNAAAQAPLRA